ncbi:MAG: ribosome-associated translation inhibitor RaiA [Planctomycetota bacterium]|nr:ribosome-associated translation inhibitor RaiA [Planctomycetota bacterium]
MNIVVKSRHMESTEPLKQYVAAKTEKLPRYYDNLLSVEVILDMEAAKPFVEMVAHAMEVILDMEADKPTVEMLVQAKKKMTFVARARNDDMYACIDQCLDKIVQQLRRHKDRVRDRQGVSASGVAEVSEGVGE